MYHTIKQPWDTGSERDIVVCLAGTRVAAAALSGYYRTCCFTARALKQKHTHANEANVLAEDRGLGNRPHRRVLGQRSGGPLIGARGVR